MKCYTIIACIALFCGLALASRAEEHRDSSNLIFPENQLINKVVKSTNIITQGEITPERRDSMEALITRFYVNQYRHFQDPRSPYFLFMSKDANLAMGLGGVVRMRGWYDFDGSIPVNGFAPYLIPIPADPTSRRKLGATAAGVSVYLTILGRNTALGNIMGFIQGGFDGYENVGFKLKNAYVTINDVTIGYTSSTFIDPATQPPTIDGQGPSGFSKKTQVLVRYFKTFRERWSVGAGVEIPSSQPATDDKWTKKCSEYVPDLAALVQYQWDGGLSHVRLSGLLHSSAYRDLVRGENHNVLGYGVQLSSRVKVTPNLNFYGNAIWGKGIGSYIADLSVSSYDLMADPDVQGKMYAPNSLGYTAGAQYFFRPNLFVCAMFGQNRYFPTKFPDDSSYRYGTYVAGNLFWDMTSRLQVGIEYLYGRRMNFDHSSGHANRIDALFQFSF